MVNGIGEESTLVAGDVGRTPELQLERDLVLRAQQAKVFGALFRKPELRRFGRYVVLDVLGQGGMGVVIKGYDDELDRQVAIKVLHEGLDEQHTARLRREAQAMAKLSHPNVVQVYEVGVLEGQTFVAMELVKGRTVRAWMDEEPRPGWKACVELFLQLGQGLAAAHKRGLVHRDFKPSNAILDEEGRARVLDFGLARHEEGQENDEPSMPNAAHTEVSATASLHQSLTRTGAVLGTPAYMPPEQMGGLAADARSDQFSFCVALFEAVYGQRPYEGRTMMALMVSMRSGVVRPASRGSDVPLALRKVLLRGLSVVPEQRWPSMESLLEELQRIVAPPRWRWKVVAVGAGLVAIGGGLFTTQTLEWLNRCTGARQQLEGAWDEASRQEVKAAILGTGLSYAPGTWERVEPRLDAYADAWAAEHTDACEATRSRDEQSEAEMGLRMGCLHGRRQHLRATVSELRRSDATVVEHAVQAVTSLPGLERCRDLEALRAEVPPPEDPAVAARVAELDERLVEAKAKENAGLYADGLRLTDEVVAEGVGLEYEPLMARAWLRQGSLRRDHGDHEGAVQVLKAAYRAAMAHTMKSEAADVSAELMFVLGYSLVRHDEAHHWEENAEPLSRAVGTDDIRAAYFSNLGSVMVSQAEYGDARECYEQALALYEEAHGSSHPLVATTLGNLGNVASLQGRLDDARRAHERALAIREQVLDPDHPDVASTLNNFGFVAESEGRLDDARRAYERALAVFEKALGPAHPSVAATLVNLGNVASLQGRLDDAQTSYERALAIREKVSGPEHPSVATVLVNLGVVAESRGELEQARTAYERALAIRERALGPDHPDVAVALVNLGALVESRGELEQARTAYERALAIFERSLGPDHAKTGLALVNLGNVAFSLGELEEAHAYYQRALTIYERTFGPEHLDLTYPLGNLGNVAGAQGKHEVARALHERALAIRETVLGTDHPDVAYPLLGLGFALLGLDEPTQALTPLERALVIRTTHEVDPALLAETHFAVARALWTATAGRDRPRARTLAEQARDAYATLGDTKKTELTEVEAWLAEHRAK